ncbi:Cell death protease [Boothiomyces macroporosus]|uniref:Cell death protease n=1 Tax=Boothiomyces macroporosus TaxID=261099 RepID=A0AAD5Y5D4_9FUNG|nr:Cell death protease [Boothiomyces macroporosus]
MKVESLPKLDQKILDKLDLYSGFIKAFDNDYFHILSANKNSKKYPAYLVYAQKHGLIKSPDLAIAQNYLDLCKKDLKINPYLISSQHCEKIMDIIMEASVKDGLFCLNKYDIRLRDHGLNEGCGMSWPPGVYDMAKYLSLHDTQKNLHVDKHQYGGLSECSGAVYSHLGNQGMESSAKLFPDLLSQVEVIMFVGDKDLICNIIGIKNMITYMEWGGAKGFTTEPEEWKLDDEMVGTITKDRNLSLYTVFDGSHMTAFDQPEATLDMIRRVLKINSTIPEDTQVNTIENNEPAKVISTVSLPVTTVEEVQPTKVDKIVASIEPEQWPEAEAPPASSDPPISFLTGLYVMFALFGVVVGAVYVMKIIRKRRPPQWGAVPEEEDLEMEERRRIE